MKRIVILFCGWWICVSSFAQANYAVSLNTGKTASLIFPAGIRHVDIGSKEVLVQHVKDAENLLFVKAGTENFKATNLSVVTADGVLYSFDVNFENNPCETVYFLSPKNGTSKLISFTDEFANPADLRAYATGILDNPRHIRGIRSKKWDMLAQVNGIYIKDGLLFFQLRLDNLSPIDYDIDFIRFYTRDTRKLKRTAVQELELVALHKAGNTSKVEANGSTVSVYAFSKFTIPDAKHLAIEVGEKNGGRHLKLKVGNWKLLQAKMLPALD